MKNDEFVDKNKELSELKDQFIADYFKRRTYLNIENSLSNLFDKYLTFPQACKDLAKQLSEANIKIADLEEELEDIKLRLSEDKELKAAEELLSDQPNKNEDLFQIQAETLELTIKAGRRLMHDFNHMLQEVPNNSINKTDYQQRAKMWSDIFYPDNGPKDYRTELHREINWLSIRLKTAQDLLKKHGIDPNPDLPY